MSPPANAPELELSLAWEEAAHRRGPPLWLALTLRNVGASDAVVMARVETPQGPHFDGVQLEITSGAGREVRTVELIRPRKAAARVVCLLEPGRALVQRVDVAAWLDPALEAGSHRVRATYSVPPGEPPVAEWGHVDASGRCSERPGALERAAPRPVWTGEIRSPTLELEIDDR
jgi:hypothetical protein